MIRVKLCDYFFFFLNYKTKEIQNLVAHTLASVKYDSARGL